MKKGKLVSGIILILLAGVIAYYFSPKDTEKNVNLSREKARSLLEDALENIDWHQAFVRRRAKVELKGKSDLATSLPSIGKFPMVVNPVVNFDDVGVEIFVSTEKSGTGADGVMTEIANDFNAQNLRTPGGRLARVRIRKIASGTGYQFIASGKYLPDGFSPSNALWVRMCEASGVAMTPVNDRMFGNIAGVVMKEAVAQRLEKNYGNLRIPTLIDAVVQGNMVMGYTNPFASSTGLNFLVTVLSTFSKANSGNMLAPDVVSAFTAFQRGVPFVALTTLQMRESVEQGGSLDAFVMEYQTFANTPVLKNGYRFIPFGYRHDNPLYGVNNPGPEKMDVLKMLSEFSKEPRYKKIAKNYGFHPEMDYRSSYSLPDGSILISAQRLWKEKKDAGRPITAIFLCDVSGSMRGERLSGLKRALLQGAEFIDPKNSIGLVLFSDEVTQVLQVEQFNLNQKAGFIAAVEDMSAGGKTAMYDGVVVSLGILLKEMDRNPDAKPILFVLSDGETNTGLTFDKIAPVIAGLRIPVYTIGYEADIEELKRLSSLVEAASLNADQQEIEYKIGSLLNAQM